MEYKICLILIICLILPQWSTQQSRDARRNGRHSGGNPSRGPSIKEPSNWKTILIIVASVLFFGAIIYGTSCFYICKMHFFDKTEKKYTKMDSCTNV